MDAVSDGSGVIQMGEKELDARAYLAGFNLKGDTALVRSYELLVAHFQCDALPILHAEVREVAVRGRTEQGTSSASIIAIIQLSNS